MRALFHDPIADEEAYSNALRLFPGILLHTTRLGHFAFVGETEMDSFGGITGKVR